MNNELKRRRLFYAETKNFTNLMELMVSDTDNDAFDAIGDGSQPLSLRAIMPMDEFFKEISENNPFTGMKSRIDAKTRAMMNAVAMMVDAE